MRCLAQGRGVGGCRYGCGPERCNSHSAHEIRCCRDLQSTAARSRYIEVADSGLDMPGEDVVPIELRILVDEVRRRFTPSCPVQTDLQFVVERVGFPQVVRIAELTDEVGAPQQRPFFVDVRVVVRRRV